MEVKPGDVLIAEPWVIIWPDDVDRIRNYRTYKGPVYMVSQGAATLRDPVDSDLTCDILFSKSHGVQQLVSKEGADRWTSGLKGTKLRFADPDEWPDEVITEVTRRKLLGEWY